MTPVFQKMLKVGHVESSSPVEVEALGPTVPVRVSTVCAKMSLATLEDERERWYRQ
uniref:Uncharacterized protein n=1 Tax=Anguilla anguilla TaxID=7936 RepID=A0A0E9QZU5_ANGAN